MRAFLHIKWVKKQTNNALDKEKEKYSALWIYFKHKFSEMYSWEMYFALAKKMYFVLAKKKKKHTVYTS